MVIPVLVGGLCGCSKTSDNAELIGIAETVSDQPREALERLAAINPDSLTERDAYYHAFLTLKANDKAYIDHTTDSVITRLLDYYDGSDLYPEVLYYAGRVYSDLGDYPTSLRYFQDALDAVPNDRDNLLLRGAIASQTGRLLNTLRLYDSAIPYLKDALRIDYMLRDTFDIVYDNLLIGDVYIKNDFVDSAVNYINSAYELAVSLPKVHLANVEVYKAIIKKSQNKPKEALAIIRGVPEIVHPLFKNAALINASDIYLDNEILDSAYIYAAALIQSTDINNIKNGYRNLLSADLIDLVPEDSLKDYIVRAYQEFNKYYNLNNAEQGIVQQSMYNYSLHDRARAKAEFHSAQLSYVLIIIVLLIIIATVVVLYYRKNLILELNTRASKIAQLRSYLEVDNDEEQIVDTTDIKALRKYIDEQLAVLAEDSEKSPHISPIILHSTAYSGVKETLEKGGALSDNNDLWGQLEAVVLKASPNFYKKIEKLSTREMDLFDRRLLLLIKAGFTPTQTGKLLSRAKGTISSRRESIRNKTFGKDFNLKNLDAIIRRL